MHAAVARLETAPVLSPAVAAAGPPPEIADPAEPTPEPIEPAKTESMRRPNRWRGTPPWLPALALVFAGVCGLAALLYWLL